MTDFHDANGEFQRLAEETAKTATIELETFKNQID
jgi:hypothetical protein